MQNSSFWQKTCPCCENENTWNNKIVCSTGRLLYSQYLLNLNLQMLRCFLRILCTLRKNKLVFLKLKSIFQTKWVFDNYWQKLTGPPLYSGGGHKSFTFSVSFHFFIVSRNYCITALKLLQIKHCCYLVHLIRVTHIRINKTK